MNNIKVTNCNDSPALIAVTFLTTHQIRGNPPCPSCPSNPTTTTRPPPPRNSVHARGRMCVPYITTLYIVIPLILLPGSSSFSHAIQQGFLRALNGPYGQEELMTINDKTPNPLLLVAYNRCSGSIRKIVEV